MGCFSGLEVMALIRKGQMTDIDIVARDILGSLVSRDNFFDVAISMHSCPKELRIWCEKES